MRKLIAVVAAAILLLACEDGAPNDKPKICTPGDTWQDTNRKEIWWVCSKDGTEVEVLDGPDYNG